MSNLCIKIEEILKSKFSLSDLKSQNCRYIPFSGGPRKCVGDQFAMMEAIVALSIFLKHMEFELVPNQKINMTTGATIHTTSVISSQ